MTNPLTLGDCGDVLDCGVRRVRLDSLDVRRAVFDYHSGTVSLDGKAFPYLVAEDGPTVELNGQGFPVTMTVPALFMVDDLRICGSPKPRRT